MRRLEIICPDCGDKHEAQLSECLNSMGGFNCRCGTGIEYTVYPPTCTRTEFIGSMKERLQNARRNG